MESIEQIKRKVQKDGWFSLTDKEKKQLKKADGFAEDSAVILWIN